MLKKLMKREEGFTLAELLIVVAIIAVLTAIAIPVFTSQMEKSREATDMANARSAYGELIAQYLTDGKANTVKVDCKQTQPGWQYQSGKIGSNISGLSGSAAAELQLDNGVGLNKKITLTIGQDGKISTGVEG